MTKKQEITKQSALDYFGGTVKLAKALGITHNAVSMWVSIPKGRQYELQVLTNGDLSVSR